VRSLSFFLSLSLSLSLSLMYARTAEKLRPGEPVEACCVRGVREELGSLVGTESEIRIKEGSMQHWEETRMSRRYPCRKSLMKEPYKSP
jgi:NADH pyrophosphatase NudC (nudix superfamily)